jgi:hypothetical protein
LATVALAITRTLIRYLAVNPNGFLELSASRQVQLGELLLICTGSRERLIHQLRQAGNTISRRLVRAFENLPTATRIASELDEHAWIDLLGGALPYDFNRLYVLLDLAAPARGNEWTTATHVRSLIDLIVPLAARSIYLKIFMPDTVGDYFRYLTSPSVVELKWNKNDLCQMLRERIRQASSEGATAGRDSLEALCDLETRGSGLDNLLVGVCRTPRDLVHWGNQLLETQACLARDKPEFTSEVIETWQKDLSRTSESNSQVPK